MNWRIIYQPYPFDDSIKRAAISAVAFGLFIFLFLLFFQPFGLSNYHSPTKTLELSAYGLVTTFCLFSNFFLFSKLLPQWFSKETWTVGKNILYTLWMFFTIGLGNLLYSVYQDYLDLSFQGFVFYQTMTVLVGVFPVVFSTLLVYHKRLTNMVKEANHLNEALPATEENESTTIAIPSSNKSEKFEIQINTLLLIKAVENYIEIYTAEGGEIQKKVVRTTLKSVIATFSDIEFIQKCHRSYIVNLNLVIKFSGNAQGLTLHFKNFPEVTVPVSRAYVKEIKAKFN